MCWEQTITVTWTLRTALISDSHNYGQWDHNKVETDHSLVTTLGKKRVLRKNLSDIAMMKVPRKRRQENRKTSAEYDWVSQPDHTPFNSWHLLLSNAAQSITASVPFPVLLSATTYQCHTLTLCNIARRARKAAEQFREEYQVLVWIT